MITTKRYALDLPSDLLGKIQMLSAFRKANNLSNKKQKDIFIELLNIGLMMIDDNDKPSPSEVRNVNGQSENPKQVKLV